MNNIFQKCVINYSKILLKINMISINLKFLNKLNKQNK